MRLLCTRIDGTGEIEVYAFVQNVLELPTTTHDKIELISILDIHHMCNLQLVYHKCTVIKNHVPTSTARVMQK